MTMERRDQGDKPDFDLSGDRDPVAPGEGGAPGDRDPVAPGEGGAPASPVVPVDLRDTSGNAAPSLNAEPDAVNIPLAEDDDEADHAPGPYPLPDRIERPHVAEEAPKARATVTRDSSGGRSVPVEQGGSGSDEVL